MGRPISFEDAKRMYVHRFTLEHVPTWAKRRCRGGYPAPQYVSDREWYDNTLFAGESPSASEKFCYSRNQTFPLGKVLDKPYRKGQAVKERA